MYDQEVHNIKELDLMDEISRLKVVNAENQKALQSRQRYAQSNFLNQPNATSYDKYNTKVIKNNTTRMRNSNMI